MHGPKEKEGKMEKIENGTASVNYDLVIKEHESGSQTSQFLTLTSGAIVIAKPMPELLMQSLSKKFPRPKPPIIDVNDEASGKAWKEENPNDPNYIQSVVDWDSKFGEAMLDLFLARSLKIKEAPQGAVPFEDDSWVEELEFLGITVPTSRINRYIMWIKAFIAPTSSDLNKIQVACLKLSGASEEDIKAAEDQFRR